MAKIQVISLGHLPAQGSNPCKRRYSDRSEKLQEQCDERPMLEISTQEFEDVLIFPTRHTGGRRMWRVPMLLLRNTCATYHNFFQPAPRWHFTGMRLATSVQEKRT
jgi:hypothetical protein